MTTVDFLRIQYTNMEFLVNRSQFSSSFLLDIEIAIKSSIPFFPSVTNYKEEYLPVFDLDAFIREHFHCPGNNPASLILIADIGSFAETSRKVIGHLNLRNRDNNLCPGHLAIKVSNQAELVTLALDQLRLIPSCLREKQQQAGILGLRFPEPGRIQYFIDSETIIINTILKRRKSI